MLVTSANIQGANDSGIKSAELQQLTSTGAHSIPHNHGTPAHMVFLERDPSQQPTTMYFAAAADAAGLAQEFKGTIEIGDARGGHKESLKLSDAFVTEYSLSWHDGQPPTERVVVYAGALVRTCDGSSVSSVTPTPLLPKQA
jgi:hypothetical protein